LEELVALRANLVYLGTIRDDIAPNKSGRIYLDDFATINRVPLHKFGNMNEPDAIEAIRKAELDWLFVIGWSQMAKAEVLSVPRLGAVGMHPTLLPKGRGRASIPWAIIKGLDESGVTMFKLDEGMDTGPILGQRVIAIAKDETSTTLYEKVVEAHRTLVRETYPGIADGSIELIPQDESQATEWPGRRPSDGLLEPSIMTAAEVDRHVRALTHPYPGAFVHLDEQRLLRIWAGTPSVLSEGYALSTLDGTFTATEHQIESRK
jgi:methionyl-tRNA formyltransferase